MAVSLCLSRSFLTRGISKSAAISCLFITPSSSPRSTVPSTSYATAVQSGGGGSHWKYERIVTVAMVGLIPAGLIYPNPVVDYGLAITLPMHGHWGLESVIEDYVPQTLKKLAYPLLYCISLGTFAGLVYLNYTDIGICNAVKTMWSLK